MFINLSNQVKLNDIEVDFAALKLRIDKVWYGVEAKQITLLKLLFDNYGQAISRDKIMQEIWPDVIVSDNSVSQLITQLRKTLRDDKGTPKFIKTVPRIGYQLIAHISTKQKEKPVIINKSTLAIEHLGYKGVGTIEYLYENDNFYFIEMNTRIQVEHTVTEETFKIDLIKEQILVAAGNKIETKQSDISQTGHSIQCRILAEDPKNFIPNAGLVEGYHPPGGHGIRIDSALYSNYFIPPHYDSLISKLIVSGSNRNDCIARLNRALKEYVISGVKTNIPLLTNIINRKEFCLFLLLLLLHHL